MQTPDVANFKFDDGEYFINRTTIDKGEEATAPSVASEETDGVKLTWATALSGSTYTVVVEGVKDAAGSQIDKVSVSVTVLLLLL